MIVVMDQDIIPTSHTLYCNTFSGSFHGTATYSNNVHVTNFSNSSEVVTLTKKVTHINLL